MNNFSLNGAVPSPIDKRDYTPEKVCLAPVAKLPMEYKLPYTTPILNQGVYGSCVAHAAATAMRYGELLNGLEEHDYSRGYIYGNRKNSDIQTEGMIIREALSQLNHCGDVIYYDFPYNNTYTWCKMKIARDKDNLASKALPHKINNYFRITKESDIKRALMTCGAVIVCSPVYKGFDGNTPNPKAGEEVEGYHALCLVGWDKTGWIFQNSWGSDWGNKGYLHVSYSYPIKEWWGITVGGVSSKKDTWLQKLINLTQKVLKKLKVFVAK